MVDAEVDLSEFDVLVGHPGPRCWADRLTDEQRAKMEAARSAGHTFSTIAKVATNWGTKVSSAGVARHLQHACSCE